MKWLLLLVMVGPCREKEYKHSRKFVLIDALQLTVNKYALTLVSGTDTIHFLYGTKRGTLFVYGDRYMVYYNDLAGPAKLRRL